MSNSIISNFTKVPNELFRASIDLSGNERLFLIYLLSHKAGYNLTDVQCANNLGISRGTVPELRKKLSQKGFIEYSPGSRRGTVYKCNIEQIRKPVSSEDDLLKLQDDNYTEKIISSFKSGIERFRNSEDYEDCTYFLDSKWHCFPYKQSHGDLRNIASYLKNHSSDEIEAIIDAFESNLADYLKAKLSFDDFRDFKTGQQLVPTISFFLKAKCAYDDILNWN